MPRAAQAAGAEFDGTPRAVIYARYSSTHQRERSIEDQIADCRAYAERCGLMVVGIYADRAISGKTDERPDFQRMIDDSKKRQFDRVIVWKLDRFARNRYDSALYKHKLKQNGVSVLSAMENIGEGDESIILEAILEASAEYYSRDLRKKVLRGMTTSAKKGLHNTGSVPYGYRLEGESAIPDGDRAEFVKHVFEAYAKGETPAELYREMQRRSLDTKANGRKVSDNIIGSILRNEKYTGRGMWRGIPVEWPRLIDDELFEAARARTEKNRRAPAAYKAAEPFILCGKAFCGYCGAPLMSGGGKGRSGKYYRHYICRTKKRERACGKKTEDKDFLEWYIVEQTCAYVLAPERLEYIADRVVECYKESFDGQRVSVLEARIAKLDRDLDKTTDLLFAAPSAAAVDRINKHVVELEAQKSELEAELSGLKIAAAITYTRDEVVAWLKQFCNGDPLEAEFRRRIVETFINSVYVYDDRIVIYFNVRGGKQISYAEMLDSAGDVEPLPPGPESKKSGGPDNGTAASDSKERFLHGKNTEQTAESAVRFCSGLVHHKSSASSEAELFVMCSLSYRTEGNRRLKLMKQTMI